ncbi:MAG: ACP S-malonyltransferase [Oligoflexia bacterium]|nr:ACP S-malonyltransferase [Oligoflexia bacterium]MBF0364472.1 ACP S-malonyltransferase [Oligoflexia bacterium]
MRQKITILFPGQGQQFVGMGNDFSPELKKYLKDADSILGYDLSKICSEGPADTLKLTANAQPAIIAYELALFSKVQAILENEGFVIERVLGHSVGEYAALVAAGSLTFQDALKLVHLRGKFMQEAVAVGVGSMVALLKVPVEVIEKGCQEVSTATEIVVPANYNDPDQVVVSGHKAACDRLCQWLEAEGNVPAAIRYRAIPLEVSAPFHSPLMLSAADKLLPFLKESDLRPNIIPYIANIDATEYAAGTDANTIRSNLYRQIAGSVRFEQSVHSLPIYTNMIEVGPGKVLKGMVKKILPSGTTLSVSEEKELAQLPEALRGLKI